MAIAALLPLRASAVTDANTLLAGRCGAKLAHLTYAARFELKGSSKRAEKMRVVIGVPSSPAVPVGRMALALPQPEYVAQIWGNGSCQAVCTLKRFEKHEESGRPLSMALQCQGARSEWLGTPATVQWTSESSTHPTIRFGSWLTGYEEAELLVSVDRYSRPSLRARRDLARLRPLQSHDVLLELGR
jgi:hypothetical protein